MSQMSRQSDILLESGTNELEIMEFTIGDQVFGINVAKVLEIIQYEAVKPMQNAHPIIEGVFKPREAILTVVDLAQYLGMPPSANNERDIFIVTNFNNMHFAFHVHSVVDIDRVSWQDIQKPDSIIYGGEEGVATGIAEFQGRLITILDFERIIMEINPQMGLPRAGITTPEGMEYRAAMPVLLVEDSMLLARLLDDSLRKAGFSNVVQVDNGREAWEYLTKLKESGLSVADTVRCVVTDIEMPQMDGHHLTKLIKDDKELQFLPVVLFSSLINEEMRLKGRQVGADAQIAKPEIETLINMLDSLAQKYR